MSDLRPGELRAHVKLAPAFRRRLGVVLGVPLVPGTNVPMGRVLEEVEAVDALGRVLDEGIAKLTAGGRDFTPRDLAAFVLGKVAAAQKGRGIRR